MSEQFLKLPKDQQRAILKGAESTTGIKPNLLEKDIWICWVLDKLFKLPIRMAFKGGTSLSKCFNLIDRFSEDVDITIDYRDLLPGLDIKTESKNSLKNKRKELKEILEHYINISVIPSLNHIFSDEFGGTNMVYELIDGEKLYINYPSVLNDKSDYVKDSVLIEFGGTNKTEPNDLHIVKTYLELDGLEFPKAQVNVYSPYRTFWEKATLIHVECHRERLTQTPDRLSRHWYDLAKLSQSEIKQFALKDLALLNDVLSVKKAFFNARYANYDKCENNQFVLIPKEEEIRHLQTDYNAMIKSAMFMREPEPFDQIINQLRELQKEINQIE